MFKKICVLTIFILFTTVSAFCAGGEQSDGGSEGSISKYDKGHKLVLSGKYLEKKADKFLKKGNTTKAEKNLAKAEKKYQKALRNISKNRTFITDKFPQNFCYIGLLNATFPEAKILLVKRNPAAVCWANFKKYFVSRKIGYWIGTK